MGHKLLNHKSSASSKPVQLPNSKSDFVIPFFVRKSWNPRESDRLAQGHCLLIRAGVSGRYLLRTRVAKNSCVDRALLETGTVFSEPETGTQRSTNPSMLAGAATEDLLQSCPRKGHWWPAGSKMFQVSLKWSKLVSQEVDQEPGETPGKCSDEPEVVGRNIFCFLNSEG